MDQTAATARSLEARQRVPAERLLAPVLSSSRVEGALSLLGGDVARFRLAAALQLTVAGLPVILYGEEVGRAGGKVPLNRGDMPWGDRPIRPGAGVPRDEGLRALYQQLLAARKAHPALTRGGHRTLSSQGDLLAFLREDAASGDAVVVVLNRGATAATATFDRPRGWGAAAPAELLGTPLKVDAGRVTVEVPPLGAALVTAGR
jgi:alpha-amylase